MKLHTPSPLPLTPSPLTPSPLTPSLSPLPSHPFHPLTLSLLTPSTLTPSLTPSTLSSPFRPLTPSTPHPFHPLTPLPSHFSFVPFSLPQPSAEDEKLAAKLAAAENKLTLAEEEKLRIQKVQITEPFYDGCHRNNHCLFSVG